MELPPGSDGNVWFGEILGNGFSEIGKISPDGAVTHYPIRNDGNVALGPDGNIWFTTNGRSIGRVTPAGDAQYHPINGGRELVLGPDGNLWLSGPGGDKISRITTDGVITEIPVASNSLVVGITAGPDGTGIS